MARTINLFCGMLVISGIMCLGPAFGQSGETRGDANHVVLISIDGFAAYHLENAGLQLPNIRRLVDNGVWAESSRTVFPSVTHPSHATLITGVSPRKHGVVGNEMTDRETGRSFSATTQTRKNAIAVPTLFDAARAAGLKTAAICWPETRGDTSVDFNILHGHDELDKAEVKPALLQMLRDAGISIDAFYDIAPRGPMVQGYRDFILAQSAAEIFRTQRPRLMAVHFSMTDGMQHSFGSDHYMALAALTQTDYHVGMILEAVKEAGLEDQTTYFIVADHGFHSVHHEVNIHPVLKASGLSEKIKLHGSGWNIFVETTPAFSAKRDGNALEAFFKEVLKIDGVDRIIRNEEYPALGYPRYEDSPLVAGQYMIVPNIDTYLVVDTKNADTRRRERRPSHTHGYLPDHPRMFPALVLSGRGIQKGKRIGSTHNVDVAPTICHILNIPMRDVEGRVLTEALEE